MKHIIIVFTVLFFINPTFAQKKPHPKEKEIQEAVEKARKYLREELNKPDREEKLSKLSQWLVCLKENPEAFEVLTDPEKGCDKLDVSRYCWYDWCPELIITVMIYHRLFEEEKKKTSEELGKLLAPALERLKGDLTKKYEIYGHHLSYLGSHLLSLFILLEAHFPDDKELKDALTQKYQEILQNLDCSIGFLKPSHKGPCNHWVVGYNTTNAFLFLLCYAKITNMDIKKQEWFKTGLSWLKKYLLPDAKTYYTRTNPDWRKQVQEGFSREWALKFFTEEEGKKDKGRATLMVDIIQVRWIREVLQKLGLLETSDTEFFKNYFFKVYDVFKPYIKENGSIYDSPTNTIFFLLIFSDWGAPRGIPTRVRDYKGGKK